MNKLLVIILGFLPAFVFAHFNPDSLKEKLYTASPEIKIKILESLSEYYKEKQNFPEAIQFSKELAELYEKKGNFKKACEFFNRIAAFYFQEGNYTLTLKNFLKSLKFAKKINDTILISRAFNNIASTYLRLNDLVKTREYLIKAKELVDTTKYSKLTISIYNNLALLYRARGEYELSSYYFNYILKLIGNKNDKETIQVYTNLAMNFNDNHQYDKSEEVLFKALTICDRYGLKYEKANLLIILIDFYLDQNKLDPALYYIKKGLELTKEISAKDVEKYMLQQYIKYFSRKYNSEIFDVFVKYKTIADSLFNKRVYTEVAKINSELEFEKTQKELNLLRYKSEKQKLKTRIFFLSTVILSFAVLFIIILFFYKRLKRKSENKLIEKTIELNKLSNNNKSKQVVLTENDKKTLRKYQSSPLSKEQKQGIKFLIEKTLREKQLFLNQDFTINKLSKEINVGRTYISQVINECYGKNFNSFINELRVNYAISIMRKPENFSLSIEQIAEMSGFNSRTVFDRVFKKNVGVTPSIFMKTLKRNS